MKKKKTSFSVPYSSKMSSEVKKYPMYRILLTLIGSYVDRNISMSAVHWSYSEASESCHGSMNSTLGKECAVNIVISIAWNSPNHVCRICKWICSSYRTSDSRSHAKWYKNNRKELKYQYTSDLLSYSGHL